MRDDQLAHAVRAFVDASGRKRDLPATVHVGLPLSHFLQIPDDDRYDAGLRTDLVERALSCLDQPEPMVWLTRPGADHPYDVDHAWCAATTSAALRAHRIVGFYVVTRQGWTHLESGESKLWERVRPKRLLTW